MAVRIQRDSYPAVAEHRLDCLRRFPKFQHHGRERMAGIVEADGRQAGLLEYCAERPDEIAGVYWRAIRLTKDQLWLLKTSSGTK